MAYIQTLIWEQSRIHETKHRTRNIHPSSGVSLKGLLCSWAASLMVWQIEYCQGYLVSPGHMTCPSATC